MADSAREWFRRVDADRSGYLDVHEMQRALALGHINFSLKTVQALMRSYEPSGQGRIGEQEYVRMHEFLAQVTNTFRQEDRTGRGALDRAAVKRCVANSGVALDEPAFERLFTSFNPDRSNQLGLPEFLALTVFLQSLGAAFNAFDPDRTGSITLNFSQAAYFSSSIM